MIFQKRTALSSGNTCKEAVCAASIETVSVHRKWKIINQGLLFETGTKGVVEIIHS